MAGKPFILTQGGLRIQLETVIIAVKNKTIGISNWIFHKLFLNILYDTSHL